MIVLTGHSLIAAPGSFRLANFALGDYLASQKNYLDRASALALAGAASALNDAGQAWPPADADAFGLTLGTHLGCLDTMKGFWDKVVEKGVTHASSLLFSHSYVNSPISLCAIEFGLKGYHGTFCAGERSGLEAVRAAFDALRLGHAQAMLCGGVEAITATREACEPLENLGEASVFFVLETAEHAAARGAARQTPLTLSTLEAAAQHGALEAARQKYGACGGALGALALADALADILETV